MPELQWLAAAFPNFVRYVVVGFALAGAVPAGSTS